MRNGRYTCFKTPENDQMRKTEIDLAIIAVNLSELEENSGGYQLQNILVGVGIKKFLFRFVKISPKMEYFHEKSFSSTFW